MNFNAEQLDKILEEHQAFFYTGMTKNCKISNGSIRYIKKGNKKI